MNSAYRGEGSKQGWTTEADLLGGQRTDTETLLELISIEGDSIELAFSDSSEKQMVGCVYLKTENETCYLGMLTVDPTLQAKGLGKEILIHSEKIARARGCTQIRMTVINTRQELIEYYERRGYFLSGKIEPFPQTDPRFGIPKSVFHFVEMIKIVS